jgi:hypothetical protein
MSDFSFVDELKRIAKTVENAAHKKDVKQMTYAELVAQLKANGKMK